MENIGLALIEMLILSSLAIVIACFLAGIGGIVRYTTRTVGKGVSVFWLIRLGIFTGIPFGIIGISSGYMTGLSRVGAISALVPAGLTLVGAVAAYLFGKGGKPAILASFAVINFSIMTVVGSLIGGRERVETEQAETSLDHRINQIKEEAILQNYRKSLGLLPLDKAEKPKVEGSDDKDVIKTAP